MSSFQRCVCIGFITLILLTSGCVQMIQLEEGTEGVVYRLGHPATQPAEIVHE